MRLTIAEKAQDASEIARVLGASRRADGYYYGGGDIVTWVVGHLIELAEPEEYDSRLRAWRRETLPIIPAEFRYRVLPKTRAQFGVIESLLASRDVTEIVNACDAAREGELIFDLVCRVAGNAKPTKRLWMQSKTDEDIRASYGALRPSSDYAGLLAAAHARQRGDWLVGINGTRALSLAAGNGRNYSLGRVITPTVALAVLRDEAIEDFTPVPYFEVVARFFARDSYYTGFYFVPPPPHTESQEKRVHRFDYSADAERVVSQLPADARAASMTEREISVKPPLLYDLTQLQREANIRHGFSAQSTLDAAQALWDAKLITYPRSASQHLSSNINAGIGKHLAALAAIAGVPHQHLALAARHVAESGMALTRRHVDDKKLTEGHHAIIPSCLSPDLRALPEQARQLYDMIARRFLAAFYPAARDARTEIITSCGPHNFLTRGTRELSPGWRVLDTPSRADGDEADDSDSEDGRLLPKLRPGDGVRREAAKTLSKKTRSPQRYTEASLLEAMESAGQHCDSEEERLAMKSSGLGTPATRASTISKAFKLGYFEREGRRFIRSSAVAREVVRRLRAAGSLLVSPSLTGKWEAELARVAAGVKDAGQFNAGVVQLTRRTVEQLLASSSATGDEADAFAEAASVGDCPQCNVAGRKGTLNARNGSNGRFLACTLARESCGYMSDHTDKASELAAVIEQRCPTCRAAMRLRHSKERSTPYLSCTAYPSCKGVYFFRGTRKRAAGLRAGADHRTKGGAQGEAA